MLSRCASRCGLRTLLSNTTYGTNHAEALGLFERAWALDARAVEAQIWLALMLINRVLDFVHGFFHYDAADVDLQRADELVAQALAVSPNSAWAHYVKGQVLRAQSMREPSRFEDAAIEYETASRSIATSRTLMLGLVGASFSSDRWTR
jgi:tetratricopeptide (TPR) repeat protein